MSTPTVATKLAIEGESQYKDAIKTVNSALGTLKSELKLVESQFSGQANSAEALSKKGAVLQKMYDEQQSKLSTLGKALAEAEKKQEAYSKRTESAKEEVEKYERALEELKNESGDTSKEQEKLTNAYNAAV